MERLREASKSDILEGEALKDFGVLEQTSSAEVSEHVKLCCGGLHERWIRSALKHGSLQITVSRHGCRAASVLCARWGRSAEEGRGLCFAWMFRDRTLDCSLQEKLKGCN